MSPRTYRICLRRWGWTDIDADSHTEDATWIRLSENGHEIAFFRLADVSAFHILTDSTTPDEDACAGLRAFLAEKDGRMDSNASVSGQSSSAGPDTAEKQG